MRAILKEQHPDTNALDWRHEENLVDARNFPLIDPVGPACYRSPARRIIFAPEVLGVIPDESLQSGASEILSFDLRSHLADNAVGARFGAIPPLLIGQMIFPFLTFVEQCE